MYIREFVSSASILTNIGCEFVEVDNRRPIPSQELISQVRSSLVFTFISVA